MNFISEEFYQKVIESNPKPLNELGEFVFYRTYSRWVEEKGRRETWPETLRRAVNFNIGLEYEHMKSIGFEPDMEWLQREAEELFEACYNTKQFLSGRTMWVGGANEIVNKKFATSNFNCAMTNIEKWDDLVDLFYLLLVGTGVGVKCTSEMAKKLAPIRSNINLLHSPYRPLPPEERLEDTKLIVLDNGYAKIYVGDSKEGWVQSLKYFLDILTLPGYGNIHTVKISYNSVRPRGERLKTFGGTASGPEPLRYMFDTILKVLRNELDPSLAPIETDEKGYGHVRPIHIMDIATLVGYNVAVGGVRRTAIIFLCDPNDWECILAKYGINGFWTDKQIEHHKKVGRLLGERKPVWFDSLNDKGVIRGGGRLNHRRMSNNSILFESKPDKDYLTLLFELLRLEGEPGFVNAEEARRRRKNMEGVNPCGESLLDNKGFCNLTTVNLTQFIEQLPDGYALNLKELEEAQRRSVRAGLRMTLIDVELPEFDRTQKRDRLLGCSLTGVQDAFDICQLDEEAQINVLQFLRRVAHEEAINYAKKLRVPTPLLVTLMKPEGSLSQVAGGVSAGLHWSHSPYYIRRIRINSDDSLVKVVKELGWTINPEVGTPGETYEEQMANANTLVIDFPICSGASRTKYEVSAIEQLNMYLKFMRYYVDHNASITISVKENEWEEVREAVWKYWDEIIGITFIALDEHSYDLAPYEAITEAEYREKKKLMKPFDPDLLFKMETTYKESDLSTETCESGACPIR